MQKGRGRGDPTEGPAPRGTREMNRMVTDARLSAARAGLIVDRERRKLRRNYAKLSQPKPMQAGATPALQLLDWL
jgi:hypothetical protein